MDKTLSLFISLGIIAFGFWVVVATVACPCLGFTAICSKYLSSHPSKIPALSEAKVSYGVP
jgi:hypothetical protein